MADIDLAAELAKKEMAFTQQNAQTMSFDVSMPKTNGFQNANAAPGQIPAQETLANKTPQNAPFTTEETQSQMAV